MMMMGIRPIGFTCCLVNFFCTSLAKPRSRRPRCAFHNISLTRSVCQRNVLNAHQEDILLYS